MTRFRSTFVLLCLLGACGSDGDVQPIGMQQDAAPPDAPVSPDAPGPDAPVSTASCDDPPPDDAYGRCGAVNDCSPPICWICMPSPSGPIWSLAGDEFCNPSFCASVRQVWRDEIADVDRSCTVDSDCTLVGGISPPTCDGAPSLAEQCEGAPMRASALAQTNLAARAATWSTVCHSVSCGTLGCIADCAPGIPRCVSGVCVIQHRSCFPTPDAG